VEEARQHSALSPDQLAFAAVWLAGPLTLAIGVFLALAFGNASIVVGLIGQAVSKTAAAFWAFSGLKFNQADADLVAFLQPRCSGAVAIVFGRGI
jgi:hypothetical protein